MQGIVLITTTERWQQLLLYRSPLAKRSYNVGPNRYVMEFEHGHIACNQDNDLVREYEPEELSPLPPGERLFVSIEYTSPQVLRPFVLAAPLGDESWIDDDNDGPVRLGELRARLHNEPEWDWRR